MAEKVKFDSYKQQPKDPVSWEIKQAAAERWKWSHCDYRGSDAKNNGDYNPASGCKLIRSLATDRAFNRYRGLYSQQTLKGESFSYDDMVQEAFLGMLQYKDKYISKFPSEPKRAIFEAIREHFKDEYKKANSPFRAIDNGKHNARIEPKQKPLKVLIDELDFDPAKEPESVKLASGVKNWRIGGITILNNQKELKWQYKDAYQWEIIDQGKIYYFDELKPGELKDTTDSRNYIRAVSSETNSEVYYRRTQIKPAVWKLKIETEKPFTKKRNWRKDPLVLIEYINLLHAAFNPEAKKPATDEQLAKQLNVYPSMLKYWRAQYPGFYPVYFPQGAPGPLTADPAYRQFIIEHFQEPLTRQQQPLTIRYYTSDAPDAPVYRQFTFEHFREPLPWEAWRFQWAKDGFSYFSNMDRRALLIQILREALAVINTMPEQQACITKLYYYQGMTQTEICALLHRSARKVQLARVAGMESIKQHFNYHYPLTDIVKILEGVRKQILNREILPL